MTEPARRPRSSAPRRAGAPRPSATPVEKPVPTGVFRPHVRGFGFVDLDEPVTAPDGTAVTSCFVPPPITKGLLADDRVSVTYAVDPDGRGTASAVSLVERVRTATSCRCPRGARSCRTSARRCACCTAP